MSPNYRINNGLYVLSIILVLVGGWLMIRGDVQSATLFVALGALVKP